MMFEPIWDDDFVIDLSEKENEDIEEFICSGRGRFSGSGGRVVPRLPHAAFIIKKQIEDEESSQGRRKRGRGRASLIRQAMQNSDAKLFKPRMPANDAIEKSDEESDRVIPVDTDRSTDGHLDFQNQEEYPLLQNNDQVLQKGENIPNIRQRNDLHGGSSDNNSDRSAERELARARRDKERQSQKESFAEINRQMFSELAISFQNEASYKPVKVMRLTKANLEQHVKETEDVLRVAEMINIGKQTKSTASNDTAELYEQFGVTLDDIWLFKQNKFKMPQEVKNKVNEINKLSKLLYEDCENGEQNQEGSDDGDQKEENVVSNNNEQFDDMEHEKQVSFLNMLYDEDSWSNQKELSVNGGEEFLEDSNDCNSDSLKSNKEKIDMIDDQIKSHNSVDAISNDKADSSNGLVLEKEELINGKVKHNSISDQTDNLISNISTDEDACNEKAADTTNASESENASFFSVTSDLDMTLKHKESEASSELKTPDGLGLGGVSPALPEVITEQAAVDKNSELGETVTLDTDTSASKLASNSDVNESSIEIIDSDISVSRDLNTDNQNIVLYSESSDSVVLVNGVKDEPESVNGNDLRETRSSVALLDEFDIPVSLKDSSNNAFKLSDTNCEEEEEDFTVVQSKGKKQKKKQTVISSESAADVTESVASKPNSKNKRKKTQENHKKCSECESLPTDKTDNLKIPAEIEESVSNKEVNNKTKSQENSDKLSVSYTELNKETNSGDKDKSHKASNTFDTTWEARNVSNITSEQTENIDEDDIEGFQVVKKKQRKKKSISPLEKQRKHAGKQEKTIWKLYGKNVLQVEGLPLDFDVDTLTNIVSGFGTVKDYQVREIEDSLSVRYRLPDEDSCDYAVQCIDQSNIGTSDENCLLSCTKLTN